MMFEPSPPQHQRKAAAKPPKQPLHKFNPSKRRDPSPDTASLADVSGAHSQQVENLMDRVHERAQRLLDEPGEKPGLHDLMKALDLILQGDEDQSDLTEDNQPSTEVANTVYRLLIKKEKQKAYDSLVTIQTEIYDL